MREFLVRRSGLRVIRAGHTIVPKIKTNTVTEHQQNHCPTITALKLPQPPRNLEEPFENPLKEALF